MIMSVWSSRDPPIRVLVGGEPRFFDRFEARLDIENGVLTYKGENGHQRIECEERLK